VLVILCKHANNFFHILDIPSYRKSHILSVIRNKTYMCCIIVVTTGILFFSTLWYCYMKCTGLFRLLRQKFFSCFLFFLWKECLIIFLTIISIVTDIYRS